MNHRSERNSVVKRFANPIERCTQMGLPSETNECSRHRRGYCSSSVFSMAFCSLRRRR